ncbi:MAG: bifunctional phosphoribosylaminoimidazolecarboxamide formyltransferase/IMP cyclohydrolase [Nitrospiraceae bacterium]|nr:bifunctional phosphoribosylaminoimidazolecarboxamide formyltransferase/IMP cyclohydrolase [Nitrospiraceae bacterium]
MGKIARALISVSNKNGILDFARGISKLGIEILSTGGTAKMLRDAGVAVKDVSEFTGFPEMLDGRVKTLHPKVHGGLLGRRNNPEHMRQWKENGIQPIDLVVVNLYPFEQTVAKPGCTLEDAIENIDIGGPTMLRSAAKNYTDVAVVVSPRDYDRVLEEIQKTGEVSAKTRFELCRTVFLHTARYDSAISAWLDSQVPADEKTRFPNILTLQFEKAQNLRYGENPHQQGAFYREFGRKEPSVSSAKQLHGKEMSFNNFLDANSALELVKEYDQIAAVIVKHNNPCGVGTASALVDAYRKARDCDPVSAFGGVIAFNHMVDYDTAKELTSTFVEVVVAPEFAPDALDELKKKKDLRLLDVGPKVSGAPEGMDLKKVVGGLIYQDRDLGKIVDVKALRVATKRKPTDDEYEALAFAWKVCKHVKSNAIVFTTRDRTIGIGAGQMSRLDSVKIAKIKAQFPLAGTVLASDAFFPFRDGLDEAAKAGVTAVIQPGGSLKDEEVIKAAEEHGIAMIMTGMRHFRH